MSKKWLREVVRQNTRRKLLKINDDAETCRISSQNTALSPTIVEEKHVHHPVTFTPEITNIFPSSALTTTVSCQNTMTNITKIVRTNENSATLANDLTNWAINGCISQTNFNKLLVILKQHSSSSEYEKLPSDCRTLLKTKMSGITKTTQNGKYHHFGISAGLYYILQKNKVIFSESNSIIEIDINVDGLPLTKSSKSQFWPILGSIQNLESNDPFVIGVFHGHSKPSSASDLLSDFIEEYLKIKIEKFFYNNKQYEIKINKFIVDIPAKTFILCVKAHNAYFGCTKCITEGTFINRRMSFPDLNSNLRNNTDFRNNIYDDYHDSETPLLKLDIDVITQFPLDYMHLVCLGVMKKLLTFWTKGNMVVRLRKVDIVKINFSLKRLKKYISSSDFSRLPRTLDEVERWKATEFRQFLLYSGPIILKNRLKHSLYIHFLSLHCAIRILATPQLCIVYNSFAKQLLKYFIDKFSFIYGAEFISHNVHNLIHLNEDVLKYGALDNFAAFKFENFMSDIKKMLKTSNNPLEQFINRINERRHYMREKTTQQKSYSLHNDISIQNEPLLNDELIKSYKFIKTKYMTFGITLKNNHCIFKKNSNIGVARIEKIVECVVNGTVFLIIKEYKNFKNYFSSPCSSKMFHCGFVDNVLGEAKLIPVESIITKCIHYRHFIISLI